MADKTETKLDPKPETKPEAAATPPAEENAAIRQMRAEVERAQQEAKDFREQLKSLQVRDQERRRLEMTEQERLQAEVNELRQLAADRDRQQEELNRWQGWAQREYDAELAKVDDDDLRSQMKRLSSVGTWQERLDSLKGARAMQAKLNAANREIEKAKAELEKAQQQSAFGTRTQPQGARPAPVPQPEPKPFNRNNIPSWNSVLKPPARAGRQADTSE